MFSMGTLHASRSVKQISMGTLHAQIEKCNQFWDTGDTLKSLSTFIQFLSETVLLLSLISH